MGSINKRDLKAYVRYDGSGRVVAGSLVLRRSIPKVGKWQEIQGYECCNQDQQTIIVDIQSIFPITNVDFVLATAQMITPNGNLYFYTGQNAADQYELATVLNNTISGYGHFKVDGYGNLILEVSYEAATIFAANGTSILGATAFAD
jgi:hypothetical protein